MINNFKITNLITVALLINFNSFAEERNMNSPELVEFDTTTYHMD